jgi:predicted metal-dependent hydrolase
VEDGLESAYEAGVELIRAGEYFAAHEALEDAWRAAPVEERDFFQGLVHVVVSAYQRARDRPVAAERQRLKALRRLAAFAPAHRGLDVAALIAALERSEPDPREQLVERDLQPPVPSEEQQQSERDEHDS